MLSPLSSLNTSLNWIRVWLLFLASATLFLTFAAARLFLIGLLCPRGSGLALRKNFLRTSTVKGPKFCRTFPLIGLWTQILTRHRFKKRTLSQVPAFKIPQLPQSALEKRGRGQSGMLVLDSKRGSLDCGGLPQWISIVYRHRHTVAGRACAPLWISGCRKQRVLGLGQ